MRKILFVSVGVAAVFLAACSDKQPSAGPPPDQAAKNTADLVAYLNAEYEKELIDSPEEMTSQGRKDRYGELDDRSEAAADQRLAWRRQSVADMKTKFDPNALSEDARLSYDIWELELKRAEEGTRWRRHRYIFSRGSSPTGIPNFLINFHRVDERSDMEAYVARIGHIDEALDQLLVRARAAAADGIHMPTFVYDQSLGEIARVVTGAPFSAGKDSALFADAKAKIKALEAAERITADQGKAFVKQVSDAMTQQMKPAYDRVAAFLKEDKPNGQKAEKQGALALPDGAKFYDAALYLSTTTEMTADEIHELGLSEVARIRAEMEKVKEATGFKGTLEEFFVFMRTDKRFYLPNNDAGAAEYIKLAEGYLAVHEGETAGVLRHPAQGRSRREASRAFSRTTRRGPALHGRHTRRLAPGRFLRSPLGHERDGDLPAREYRVPRRRARSSHADFHPAGADGPAEVQDAVRIRCVL